MKVSVIIPAFNSEGYISDALSSVARQSHQNLEVVVVDDGSTDNTVELTELELSRLELSGKVVRRPITQPKGAGSCRNLGAAHSSGEVLAFLDSDDIWKPDHLERALVGLYTDGFTAGAYCAQVMTFSDQGNEGRIMPEGGFDQEGVQDILPELLQHMFVPNTTLCVQRHLFLATRGYSTELRCYEDWWLVLQLASITRFMVEKRVASMVRVRAGSLSREATESGKLGMSRAMYRDQLRLLDRAKAARFLNTTQLDALRHAIVARNKKELSDHLCAGHFVEAERIAASLFSAGSASLGVASEVAVKALQDTMRRGFRRVMKHSRRAPAQS